MEKKLVTNDATVLMADMVYYVLYLTRKVLSVNVTVNRNECTHFFKIFTHKWSCGICLYE